MSLLTVYHSESFPIGDVRAELEKRDIHVKTLASLRDLPLDDQLRVVLLDDRLARDVGKLPAESNTMFIGVGLSGDNPLSSDPQVYLHLSAQPQPNTLRGTIQRAAQHALDRDEKAFLTERMGRVVKELDEIHKIGIALSTVRDHDVLLPMILTKAREISRSDAGSLYLLGDDPEMGKVLRWKLAQNDSIPVSFQEKVLSITKESLAGYVALTGETLVIDDAYQLPDDVPYQINTSFDIESGYRTRSMLVFPMANHNGETIGVLQLINRKKEGAPSKLTAADVAGQVVPFDQQTIRSMQSLAGAAAVAVENNYLYEAIERLFEGFVTASVTAIEQRDPTTSGHSFRVAELTVELAKTLDRLREGPFQQVRFTSEQIREIRYASLLHDFGKVGVREKVLVKEKKLYPFQIDLIRSRFEFLIRSIELEAKQRKLDYMVANGRKGFEKFAAAVDKESLEELQRARGDLDFVLQSNEPTVLPEGEFQHLQQLAAREFTDLEGNKRPLLDPEEVRRLSIRKGNLDIEERGEIESHVTHTFDFLSKIPWTNDLRFVPEIAYAHHEKLNGRGYPRGLAAEAIPVQSKMMTVSDIYDALTASDRPYKKAVPADRALDILGMEVRDGLLDSDVVQVFIESKVFEKTVRIG
ncbi:MAG TPA: HD domain-containing phosphohydrolase [Thermoanaerobaculia bacterium]|nr:HD domain-containing phosphohydrolase [Thermoanaerobaculia bacterium]